MEGSCKKRRKMMAHDGCVLLSQVKSEYVTLEPIPGFGTHSESAYALNALDYDPREVWNQIPKPASFTPLSEHDSFEVQNQVGCSNAPEGPILQTTTVPSDVLAKLESEVLVLKSGFKILNDHIRILNGNMIRGFNHIVECLNDLRVEMRGHREMESHRSLGDGNYAECQSEENELPQWKSVIPQCSETRSNPSGTTTLSQTGGGDLFGKVKEEGQSS